MEARNIIKQIMSNKKVTNAELARTLGVTQATIWDRLNNKKGRRDIPVSLLNEMLSALDCQIVITPKNCILPQDAFVIDSENDKEKQE